MMKITVEKARACDIDFIARLEKETFSLPETKEDLEKMLSDGEKLLLAAFADGEIAGYIGAYTVMGESDIMTVAVDIKHRRHGIGRALVEALCKELEGESKAIFLEVRQSNTAARTLYASLGFYEVGARKGYYKLPTEDAILCKKDL